MTENDDERKKQARKGERERAKSFFSIIEKI
jgi:hypothetical protein